MPERNSSEGANKFELKSSFIILSLLSAFNKDLLSAYYVPAIMLGDVDAKELHQWRELWRESFSENIIGTMGWPQTEALLSGIGRRNREVSLEWASELSFEEVAKE